jgi:hypothetical protein
VAYVAAAALPDVPLVADAAAVALPDVPLAVDAAAEGPVDAPLAADSLAVAKEVDRCVRSQGGCCLPAGWVVDLVAQCSADHC